MAIDNRRDVSRSNVAKNDSLSKDRDSPNGGLMAIIAKNRQEIEERNAKK